MSEPFLGEIQLFAFDYAPRGWAVCNGNGLPIQQNAALYSLIGVNYGGNGQSFFQLPNFNDRAAAGHGSGPGLTPRSIAQTFGQAAVALNVSQLPPHRHTLVARQAPGSVPSPVGAAPATSVEQFLFDTATNAPMASLAPAGSGAAHENRQPYLAVNICIAIQGIFPG